MDDDRQSIDGAKQVLREITEKLKEHLPRSTYRRFIHPIRFVSLKQLQSSGCSGMGITNNFANAFLDGNEKRKELCQHLFFLLGYAINSQNGYVLEDFHSSRIALKAFTEITYNYVFFHKGDSLGLKLLPENAHLPFAVVYLFYHVYIEILLLLSVFDSMLPHIGPRFYFSLDAVETSCRLLDVMQSGSETQSKWKQLKSTLISFMYSEGKSCGPRSKLLENVHELFSFILTDELKLGSLSSCLSDACYFIGSISALLRGTLDEIGECRVSPEAATVYTNASLKCNCFGEEFEETVRIVIGTLRMPLVGAKLDRFYTLLVWQAENVLSHFKPESVEVSHFDVNVEFQRQKSQLCQSLKEVEDAAVSDDYYRWFVRTMYVSVDEAIRTDGAVAMSEITATEGFRTLALKTSAVRDVLHLLGYEEARAQISELVSGIQLIRDYIRHRPLLEFFRRHAERTGLVYPSRLDPAARHRPVESIGETHTSTLIAYLSYHFHFQIYLLALHTPLNILHTVEPYIKESFAEVDAAAAKLKIVAPGSKTRQVWSDLKQKIIKYVAASRSDIDRDSLHDDICEVGNKFVEELPDVSVVRVWLFSYNIAVLTGITYRGSMMRSEYCDPFERICTRFSSEGFTDEFMAVNRDVVGIVCGSKHRDLNGEEVERLYRLCAWEGERFLSHFLPDGFVDFGLAQWMRQFAEMRIGERSEVPALTSVLSSESNSNESGDDVENQTEKKDEEKKWKGENWKGENVQCEWDEIRRNLSSLELEILELEEAVNSTASDAVKAALQVAIDVKKSKRDSLLHQFAKQRRSRLADLDSDDLGVFLADIWKKCRTDFDVSVLEKLVRSISHLKNVKEFLRRNGAGDVHI